jgi:ABC-type bacteriocin/lantibiotic exporter with double-glycine peptidase domain
VVRFIDEGLFSAKFKLFFDQVKTNDHSNHHNSTEDSDVTPSPQSRLLELLRPESKDIFILLLLALISGILYLATPLAVDAVVNNIAFGGQEAIYIQALFTLTIALFIFLIMLGVIRASQHYVMEIVQRRLVMRIAADMSYRLPRVKYSALDDKMKPDLVNRFFDIITVEKSSALLLLEGVNLVLGAVVGLIVLAFYHPFLLIFNLILIALIALIIFGLGRRAVKTKIAESYKKHALVGWLEQIALYPLLFKSDSGPEMACRRSDQLGHEYLVARRKHFKLLLLQIIGFLGLQAFANAALLSVGGYLVLKGELTLGQLVASELIVAGIVSSLSNMGKHLEAFYDAMGSIDKLGYVVDLPIERQGGQSTAVTSVERKPFQIEFRKMSFNYGPRKSIIENFSLHVPAGSRVAVTGPLGSGSTTMLDILFGLRKPTSGQILVDGIDLRQWDLRKFRASTSLLRYKEIIEGTVLENILAGREDIELKQINDVLDRVNLTDMIARLDNGLDTHLKPGAWRLYHSSRILLVLARVLVDPPSLLIVDRFLKELDFELRAKIVNELFDRSRSWTLFMATWDKDLVDRCDIVIELSHEGSWTVKNNEKKLVGDGI